MVKKKISLVIAAALTVTSLFGCSSSGSDSAATSVNQQVEEGLLVQVKSIDSNKVTAVIGTLESGNMDMNGENMPQGGEIPSGEMGEKPEMPEGSEMPEIPTDGEAPQGIENSEGTEPPEIPEGGMGEMPEGMEDGNMPGNGGQMGGAMSFVEGDTEITFDISNSTDITIEMLEGSQEGTVESISVGAVLEITVNSKDIAETIIIRNLMSGGGFGGSGEVTNGTSANTIDSDSNINGETYVSTGDDENALRIDEAVVTLDSVTIEKSSGNSSNTEDGDFYGQNAAFLALNGAEATINNATVNTSAVNGNGIFSYGEGTVVNISDSTINTTENNSGGIQTTGGGTMNAKNIQITTQGDSAAAIRSDRGGGTVDVENGTYETSGYGSPAVYSTADITVRSAVLTANNSEAIVVEGKNSVALEGCTVTGAMSDDKLSEGDNVHNIMIYQSMSGDSEIGHSTFTAKGGSITANKGDMIYVTNTTCTIELEDVELGLANDTILRVEGNTSSKGWGTQGSNGGDCIFTNASQILKGNIIVDSISSMDMSLTEASDFNGAINPENEGGIVNLTIDSSSKWTLTTDSYITEFNGDLSNIDANGYKLYVNGEQVL